MMTNVAAAIVPIAAAATSGQPSRRTGHARSQNAAPAAVDRSTCGTACPVARTHTMARRAGRPRVGPGRQGAPNRSLLLLHSPGATTSGPTMTASTSPLQAIRSMSETASQVPKVSAPGSAPLTGIPHERSVLLVMPHGERMTHDGDDPARCQLDLSAIAAAPPRGPGIAITLSRVCCHPDLADCAILRVRAGRPHSRSTGPRDPDPLRGPTVQPARADIPPLSMRTPQ